MQKLTVRCLFVCSLAVVPVYPVLIDFTSRTDFGNQTTLATGLPNATGVDFSSAALCPTGGCAPNADFRGFVGTNPVSVTFPNVPNFSLQGYWSSSVASNVTRLYLAATNYVSPASGSAIKYGTPIMSTRNLHEGPSTVSVRINLPTGTNAFAIDLSNGCKIHTTSGSPAGCDPGDNHLGSVQITTSANDTKILDINDPSGATAEFRTYAARSTVPINYIDLSLPTLNEAGQPITNIGALVFTRIAFGIVADVPEPATWALLATGLALLLLGRRRKADV